MLPGIRILFAIMLLSVSVLIFGLGAAAYLRSAHEHLANATVRPIETPIIARLEQGPATLALLRIEPEITPEPPSVKLEPPAAAAPPAETRPVVETPVAAITVPPATEVAAISDTAKAPTAEPTPALPPAVKAEAAQPAAPAHHAPQSRTRRRRSSPA